MQKSPGRIVVVKRCVDRIGGQHRRQRQGATGQALGQANEISTDAGHITREALTGAAKPGGDFVGNQVHLILRAQSPRTLQIVRVVDGHAGGALHHGLDDQCSGVCMVMLQPFLQGLRCRLCLLLGVHTGRSQARIRARHHGRTAHQGRIGAAKQRYVRHSQCAHRFTVVALGQTHKTIFLGLALVAPIVHAHLQRDLGGAGAVAGVKGMPQSSQLCQALR